MYASFSKNKFLVKQETFNNYFLPFLLTSSFSKNSSFLLKHFVSVSSCSNAPHNIYNSFSKNFSNSLRIPNYRKISGIVDILLNNSSKNTINKIFHYLSRRCVCTAQTRFILTEKFHKHAKNEKHFQKIQCINLHTSKHLSISNPYEVLNLKKNATFDEIKKRFRELAKKYHPDLNPNDKSAQEKMTAITAAYELLSNPEKRKFYDQTGMTMEEAAASDHADMHSGFASAFTSSSSSFMFTDFAEMFSQMASGNPFSGRAAGGMGGAATARGADIQTEIAVDLMEAIHGCEKIVKVEGKVRCDECKGNGCSVGTSQARCKECKGSGVQRVERGPIIIGVPCNHCNGSGFYIPHPCNNCKGTGVRTEQKSMTLDIPPGVREGMELRVANAGHAGIRGGKSGHLFVTVNIRPHKIFRWIEDDIHCDIDISIKQCLLGDTIEVPSLDGTMKLFLPPNTSPNTQKVIKGKGPPKVNSRSGSGNLILHFNLKMPSKLTTRQVQLIEEFDRIQHNKINNNPVESKFHFESFSTSSPPPPPPPPPPPSSTGKSSESKIKIKSTSNDSNTNRKTNEIKNNIKLNNNVVSSTLASSSSSMQNENITKKCFKGSSSEKKDGQSVFGKNIKINEEKQNNEKCKTTAEEKTNKSNEAKEEKKDNVVTQENKKISKEISEDNEIRIEVNKGETIKNEFQNIFDKKESEVVGMASPQQDEEIKHQEIKKGILEENDKSFTQNKIEKQFENNKNDLINEKINEFLAASSSSPRGTSEESSKESWWRRKFNKCR